MEVLSGAVSIPPKLKPPVLLPKKLPVPAAEEAFPAPLAAGAGAEAVLVLFETLEAPPKESPPVVLKAVDGLAEEPKRFVGGGCAGVVLPPKRDVDEVAGCAIFESAGTPDARPEFKGLEVEASADEENAFEKAPPNENSPGVGAAAGAAGVDEAADVAAAGVPKENAGFEGSEAPWLVRSPPKAGAGLSVSVPGPVVLLGPPKEKGFC